MEGVRHKISSDNNQPKKVLLVEDNRVNRLVVEKLLERWGYAVTAVGDGMAALKVAALEMYDLVLMNLRMPGMHGRETSKLIRRLSVHYQFAPIIAFSSNGEQLFQCRELFTDFIEVPYVPEELKNLLELHLPDTRVSDSNGRIEERLDEISGGDDLYRRQLVSLFLKNCAEILEDLQMGRLESPSYLSQVRHKHKSSLRLLEMYALEVALDNLQEVLNKAKRDPLMLQFRKQAVAQQVSAVIEEFNLINV